MLGGAANLPGSHLDRVVIELCIGLMAYGVYFGVCTMRYYQRGIFAPWSSGYRVFVGRRV